MVFAFGRDTAKLAQTARTFGGRAAGVAEAVAWADVVVLTTPWAATAEALKQAGAPTPGKILWDCTNALKPDMSGLAIGTTTSAGEEVAKLAPWARVVKAIPPFAELLHAGDIRLGGAKPGVFVCGDDADARKTVLVLVEQLGAAGTEAGPLVNARYTEPLGMLLVQLAYGQAFGAHLGVALLRGR